MKELRIDELMLAEDSAGPCVSIYLPTYRAGRETRQGATVLHNLLREARSQAAAQGIAGEALETVLVPAIRLLAPDERSVGFWQHQQEGLAILLTEGNAGYARVPHEFEAQVVVGSHLHKRPLLPLREDLSFTLLAFSQNRVRLLHGSRWELKQSARNELPDSMAEVLWADDPEKSLQHHSYTTPSGAHSVLHGQGVGTNDERNKDDLVRYFQALDTALLDSSIDRERPLVLAAVDYLTTIYQSISKHPDIVEQAVAGSPDELSEQELHAAAWNCLQPRLHARHQKAISNLQTRLGTGKASDELTTIVRGAHNGRIEELFVRLDTERFGAEPDGVSNPDVHEDRKPGTVDLIGVAADATLRAGGTVHVLEKNDDVRAPDGLAATFRF